MKVRRTRLTTGVCFALLASGCGGGQSPVPTAPTRATVAPQPLAVTNTITAVVTDESGQPIASAYVDAFLLPDETTYSNLHHNDPLTDANGHYQMTGLPSGTHLLFRYGKDGYVSQCAAAPVTVEGDLTVDFTLFSHANLTAQSAPGLRSVSGTVVTATGQEPVSGAPVYWEAYEDFEPAITFTDQLGRFALCGLPVDQTVAIDATLSAAFGGAQVPPGQTTGVQIVLGGTISASRRFP